MIESEIRDEERELKEEEASKSRQTERERKSDSELKKTRMGILVVLD
jgi:hypothetical protein